MTKRLHELTAAPSISTSAVLALATLSPTVFISASTISAASSDQSYNDSANGFLAAGFAAGDSVYVQGFGTGANNVYTGRIATATDGKITVVASGSPLVDEAAGATVVITKWETRRAAVGDVVKKILQFAVGDESTAVAAGTGLITLRAPQGMTVTEVRGSLNTAQASGSLLTVDVNVGGSSILSTALTFDNTEKTTVTATTPAVISSAAIADDAEITVDVDQIGDGTAVGLKLALIGY